MADLGPEYVGCTVDLSAGICTNWRIVGIG